MIVNDDNDIAKLFAAALQSDGFKEDVRSNSALTLEKIRSNPDGFSLISSTELSSKTYTFRN